MRLSGLCALLLFFPLHADQRVEIVANFPIDARALTEALHRQNLPLQIHAANLKEYPTLQLAKNKWARRWHTLSHALFPPKILGEEVCKLIFFNITGAQRNTYALHLLPKEKLVLFMWEPPSVLGKMYKEKVHALFGRVYTWDDALVDNKKFFKFYYPVLQPMLEELPPFEEKKLCTLVSSNRTSRHPDELYSERIKAIEYFESAGEEGFEFYGRGWDPTRYKSYRGSIPDKLSVIQRYRFSICYENICDIQGYVTEKIFDCFAAGNVPVYWGACNIESYIPKGCFIDRRDFSSLEELHAFLKKMTKEEYEGYIANIRLFLKSEEAKRFSQETYEKILGDAVRPK